MKTRTTVLLALFVLMVTLLESCIFLGPSIKGNGHVVEAVREVEDFDKIKVSTGLDAWITQGEQNKVTIVADENLHEVIFTKVIDGTLKIYTDSRIRNAKEKKVLVTVRELSRVGASAGANVFGSDTLICDEIELSASSGSNIYLDISSKKMQVRASSGANASIRGSASRASLDASSGSNIRAQNLVVEDCEAEASSGANVFVTVLKKVKGKASSGGNVNYSGTPEIVDVRSSSGGNVIHQK